VSSEFFLASKRTSIADIEVKYSEIDLHVILSEILASILFTIAVIRRLLQLLKVCFVLLQNAHRVEVDIIFVYVLYVLCCINVSIVSVLGVDSTRSYRIIGAIVYVIFGNMVYINKKTICNGSSQ
jgi:hypothetical protein